MNTFQSSELFGVFLIFVIVFIVIVLLDCFYYNCTSTPLPYVNNHRKTFRFYVKQTVARLLLKLGKHKSTPVADVDKLHPFADTDSLPVDAVYFNTSSLDNQILVFATARRKNGLVNTMGFLKVPEFSQRLLVLPVFPHSTLYQTDSEKEITDGYAVAGIKLTPIKPMKEYHIEYNGKMRYEKDITKEVDVQIDAIWSSNLPTFNFSTDISEIAMSIAMASEPWSRQYFNNLKSHHQTHFEQYGNVVGVAKINGKDYKVSTGGLRDRTFGAIRDWKDFHRYVLHFIRLENGNAITIGVISVPTMFTRLVIGFVTRANDGKNVPIHECSINLNEFDNQPPDEYHFDFQTSDDSFIVNVKNHTKTELYMGEQSECRLVEMWCDYKVNAAKGCGAAEWQYRN